MPITAPTASVIGMLTETFTWKGDEVRWSRRGSGPPVVFCHGTPWSAALWEPIADVLSADFTVHLWDMPGYGTSTMADGQDVSLAAQGRLLSDLLVEWGLDGPETAPHVVAHDIGGTVALRAHLLQGTAYRSLTPHIQHGLRARPALCEVGTGCAK